ncbi:MAG: RNA-binding transcriptional accessory protein [Betaproteobacteria bacterium]|nr:RNA-binding transcriptional accessory protein [Betaproteobacteria bacterium]
MANKDILLTPEIVNDISTELSLGKAPVENTLKLILDDCTVPFIARYRKEATGGLDEVQIRDIRDRFEYLVALSERKETILKSIHEQGKLTPALETRIKSCKVKAELEDLYLPFKPKKRTRGQIAKERGLEPLALEILKQEPALEDLVSLCVSYVGQHPEVTTLEVAIQGAKDYIAEHISERAEIRGELRQWIFDNATFVSVARDEHKDKKTKYNNYYDFREPVSSIAAHRLMALRRGEKEEIIKVTIDYDADTAMALVSDRAIDGRATTPVKTLMADCVKDAFSRLLATSIETELRLETKNRAEEEAITVFAKNLRSLLLLPPIPKKIVLGVDPGIRTGSKLVVVDETGKLLDHSTIFPDLESPATAPKNRNAAEKAVDFITKYKVEYVSIGNGTAGRELDDFFHQLLEANKSLGVKILVVNEAGASVYSASDVARDEFPDLDLTYRGAVSIARRLQDPLAELVKIEPKSIGVGQYQHDVNQSRLKKQLDEVVESCVNYVGVNLNTASPSLLSYVAGIGPTLAKNIVKHREQKGIFKDRNALFEVMGFGPKAFEQAAGFLRIPEAGNPLDNTAVHPEAYRVVEKIAGDLNKSVGELIGLRDVLNTLDLKRYVTEDIGVPTLQDIIKELLKPGRDPREDGVKHTYNREVRDLNSLQEGMVLQGTVTNVTNFGAFVDIGVHQDGLIHISELSSQFVKDASQAIAVGDQVKVKVIGVDKERKRISLSRRAVEEGVGGVAGQRPAPRAGASSGQGPSASRNASSANAGNRPQASSGGTPTRRPERNPAPQPSGPASLQDLLNKFNNKRL